MSKARKLSFLWKSIFTPSLTRLLIMLLKALTCCKSYHSYIFGLYGVSSQTIYSLKSLTYTRMLIKFWREAVKLQNFLSELVFNLQIQKIQRIGSKTKVVGGNICLWIIHFLYLLYFGVKTYFLLILFIRKYLFFKLIQ